MLSTIRVVDLTSAVVGPYATQILADAGADVIKVESKGGDVMRWIAGPSPTPGMPGKFLHMNRNKRSIALDLKHPEGRAALLDVIASADVVLQNMRPAAIRRLGLTPQDIAAVNPKAVTCSVVGFSQKGPWRDRPAYDSVLQGASGLASLMAKRSGGEPAYVPFVVIDRMAATMVATQIMMALFDRERTGTVRHLEIPMYESFVALLLSEHMYGRTFMPALGDAGDLRLLDPNAAPVATSDGYICITTNTDAQVLALFDAMGRPELKEDSRFNTGPARIHHITEFFSLRARELARRPTAYWLEALSKMDVPAMELRSVENLLDEDYLYEVGLLTETEHPSEGPMWSIGCPSTISGHDGAVRRHAPQIGEHTREILREAGCDGRRLEALFAARAAFEPTATGHSQADGRRETTA
ncbi:CaiB/BaiF CoA transferase family protein [Enterovirga rhinocerotis]|uniref:Crotonobetainyl-CoA:carnitine CoA-transferase CaiB-like acyl-CoA transferase n=1 Tax=Enterovirga rhinocerotis TaxID=1339210 RepID=A0A4V3DYJ6_9HYPH|nr:CoA transferase [Enterovirga rhinocerotis]TDR92909.1 crotonobetainyl-CoA:carnitine CoA-transferase CaiB-like acyl-CoA transferase [Enterovirga rhinocerotis]